MKTSFRVWMTNYRLLMEYIAKYDDIPRRKYVSDCGKNIGSWMYYQLARYKKNLLHEIKIGLIDALHIGDYMKSGKWEYSYDAFIRYYRSNNCSIPPHSYVSENGLRTGAWILQQRSLFNRGELRQDRADILDRYSPNWRTSSLQDKKWESSYRKVVEYANAYGKLPKSSNSNIVGKSIIVWITTQRVLYKLGKLRKDRERMLDNIHCWKW